MRTAISLIQKQNIVQTDLQILGNGINKRRKSMKILSPTLRLYTNKHHISLSIRKRSNTWNFSDCVHAYTQYTPINLLVVYSMFCRYLLIALYQLNIFWLNALLLPRALKLFVNTDYCRLVNKAMISTRQGKLSEEMYALYKISLFLIANE